MTESHHLDNRLWCWSRHPDGPFHGPDPDQGTSALDALSDPTTPAAPESDQPWVYLGRCAPALASSFLPDLDELIGEARRTAHEMHRGEPRSARRPATWLGGLTLSEHQDLLDRVGRAFDDWATQHHRQPEFFRVEDVQALTWAEADAVATEYAREQMRDFAGMPRQASSPESRPQSAPSTDP